MKKKFDIIEYIKCYIKMYDDGYYSKTDLIDNLSDTLSKGSWQMHCDGKDVTNNSIKGFDFDGNPQTYYVVSDWCREEED